MPSKKTALTDRDLALLHDLVERQAETLGYLERRYFDGVRKTALNRLRRLELGGYLTRTDVHTIEHPGRLGGVYSLGPTARKALFLRSLHADEQWLGEPLTPAVRDSSLPHQVAINRVADWLGARLLPEHLVAAPPPRRDRPDAIYRAATPDDAGRWLVSLEVDLGHYAQRRILDKVHTFLDHPDARAVLFATPTDERTHVVTRWIVEHFSERIMTHVQTLSFEEIRAGGRLHPRTEPAHRRDAQSSDRPIATD